MTAKENLKKFFKIVGLYNFARKFYHLFKNDNNIKIVDNRMELEQMIQVGIMNQYKIMASLCVGECTKLTDMGFKAYSQFDEDGILL